MRDSSISLKEFITLLYVKIKTIAYNFIDFFKAVFYYYSNFNFFKIDSYLIGSYLSKSPFEISKTFLLEKGKKNIYTYGETPLATIDTISRECGLSKNDTVFELGCGRGRTCFWLHSFIGCNVVGIDHIPQFIDFASAIQKKLNLTQMEFRLGDICTADYTGATCIYLYGTCLEPVEIQRLIEKFSALPAGTQIITVSYPLEEFSSTDRFEVMKRFPASFSWGTGDVYLQVIKP